MKVIDARSGCEMKIGDTVEYCDGESVTLLDVDPGLFSAEAIIRVVNRDHTKAQLMRQDIGKVVTHVIDPATAPLVTRTITTPLRVRWMHPGFRFQHVAFIPS